MPEDLSLIIILIDFIGFSLWISVKPGPWPCISFLGTFVVGGLIL